MDRMSVWVGLVIGSAIYAALKIGFGLQDTSTTLAEAFDCIWWSGATLLIHWISTSRWVRS